MIYKMERELEKKLNWQGTNSFDFPPKATKK